MVQSVKQHQQKHIHDLFRGNIFFPDANQNYFYFFEKTIISILTPYTSHLFITMGIDSNWCRAGTKLPATAIGAGHKPFCSLAHLKRFDIQQWVFLGVPVVKQQKQGITNLQRTFLGEFEHSS